MYDTETGQSQNLPPMIQKRSAHCAVIINNVIVVLDGLSSRDDYLNSVEIFTIGVDGWKELPDMKETRRSATAVIKQRNWELV